MKEDILEQIVEDSFVAETGWFVKHNVKYRPSDKHQDYNSKQDSVHSDIDILAISPLKRGRNRVVAVTCKSWQAGFRGKKWLEILEADATYNEKSLEFQKREEWKRFREITSGKWIESFIEKIQAETGQRKFTYRIAITRFIGDEKVKKAIENSKIIKQRFRNHDADIQIEIRTLEQLIAKYQQRLKEKKTPALEGTDVGRLLQLMNAAKIDLNL